MIGKLKFLGLALVAVFAMSAVGASAASAVEFHVEKAPAQITVNQEGTSNGFDVQFGEVKCTTATYDATTKTVTTETTIELTPHYTGCTFAGVATEVHHGNCKFVIHITGTDQGTVTIDCPVGEEITVTGGTKCTVHIPSQDVGEITLTNIPGNGGTTREITAHLNSLTKIKYTQTPGTGVGKCTSLTTEEGKYTGTATVKAETDPGGVQTGVFFT
jgi:hypothetical protein